MNIIRSHSLSLNLGHALDHFFVLIFPTVILSLQNEWNIAYADLLKYGSLGVFALGLGSLPAGWLGDRWSREGMMKLFFFGMGASAIFCALATNPVQLALGVGAIGLFASIYHPVGTALVFATSDKPGRALAINGLAGNLGLASAAAVTAFLTENISWQSAFIIPGLCSIAMGFQYHWASRNQSSKHSKEKSFKPKQLNKHAMIRLFAGIAVVACFGGLVFQTLTTSLPKILETSIDSNLTGIGSLATLMFTLAAFIQLAIGELLDRIPAKRLLMAICSLQVLTLLLSSIAKETYLLFSLTALLLATFAQIPVNDWLIGHYSTEEWRSRFYAIKYTLALGMSVIAYWLIATVYGETQSFWLLYIILAVLMCCSVVAAMAMPKGK
ncbi:MFS transporter [Endozoicomonas arenosclerae]|uniref:MFS transporter n=1 Tax=Endozoicomonas arenosclerae TaxID=1633495 RepID=UPI0007829025|nr:MFS transporter [Endozoicomonas arenosclerae]